MVAIRNSALKLLAVGLLVSGVAMAQSQISCTTFGSNSITRAEGKAELLGDINLECVPTGAGVPSSDFFQVNFEVELSVAVTNNINFGEGNDIVDAVLIVNGQDDVPNVNVEGPYYGRLTTSRRIVFDDVQMPFPGFAGNPDITSIRITSIRGNAASLGITQVEDDGAIQAEVSVSPATNIFITNHIVQIADVEVGLITEISGQISGLQCVDSEESLSGDTTISLREGFAASFKTIGVPSFLPGTEFWESGYLSPGSNNDAGASQSTQFRVGFSDIPSGVTVSVPEVIDGTGDLRIAVVPSPYDYTDEDYGACLGASTTDGIYGSVNVGSGDTIVYFVCDENPNAVEEVDIPIFVSWNAGEAEVGSSQVSATFFPVGGSDVADDDDPEPRFVDTSSPEDFFSLQKCVTTLLFPFVTNRAGFDTGLVISNTSDDWGLNESTDPQEGICEVHYIANGAIPNNVPSGEEDVANLEPVASGDQMTWLVSSGGSHGAAGYADFQGYVLAACEFQYAHGYAYITDGFGGMPPALAQGYLALVIPADRSLADGQAESLGN